MCGFVNLVIILIKTLQFFFSLKIWKTRQRSDCNRKRISNLWSLVKNCEYDYDHQKEDEKEISVDMSLMTLESNFNFSSSEYINI